MKKCSLRCGPLYQAPVKHFCPSVIDTVDVTLFNPLKVDRHQTQGASLEIRLDRILNHI